MLHKMLKKLNPMSLLLVKDGYPPAVLVALLLHGGLLYFLLDRDLAPRDSVDLEQTMFVSAMTIDQNPQRLRRIQQEQEREQALRDAQREAEREAQREAEREREQQAAREAEAERQREAAAERQRQEEETARRQREETERRQQAAREEAAREQAQREQAAREQAAREQVAREAREQAARERATQQAAEQAAADNRAVQAYTATIRENIGRNWSIPPSARNGMSVLLEIRLVPTGEVISVNILKSSGDPAFDRSAEQAVLKAARFPELQQMPTRMFERQFRSFNLLFRPEDLLR